MTLDLRREADELDALADKIAALTIRLKSDVAACYEESGWNGSAHPILAPLLESGPIYHAALRALATSSRETVAFWEAEGRAV